MWVLLLSRDIRPADRAPGELHVTDECLDGRLSDQPHEEELGDEAGGDSAECREAEQEAAEALRLAGVLHALVLRQSHLGLLLQGLHVDRVRQATGIWREERDGLEAAVLSRVHLEPRQFIHLVLENPHLIHEGDYALGRHRRRVEASGRQQGGHVEWQSGLGGVQDKQLTPAQPQQSHLIRDWQLREIGYIPGPLHNAEEKPRGQFADVIDAHGIVGAALLAVLVSVSAVGVRLSSQQLGDKLGHGLTAATTSVVVVKFAAPKTSGTAAYGSDGGTEARLWGDATALNFFAHADTEALLQPAVLALVSVMLVDLALSI